MRARDGNAFVIGRKEGGMAVDDRRDDGGRERLGAKAYMVEQW